MNQNSQIYLNINIEYKNGEIHNMFFARDFRWNCFIDLVSRAQSVIEYLKNKNKSRWLFDDTFVKKIKSDIPKIMEINFDRKNIEDSLDILDKYAGDMGDSDFGEYIFDFKEQNNDGVLRVDFDNDGRQLYIDFTVPYNSEIIIKYAFCPADRSKTMDAAQYIDWENLGYEDNWKDTVWELWGDKEKDNVIRYTEHNIAFIQENAELMNKEELERLISDVISRKEELLSNYNYNIDSKQFEEEERG